MDFSRLPAPVFLKIFEYLPLENCIRVGRVNKTFRQIGELAISRTKSLDLTEDRFRNLTSDQLAVILDLCSPNLERIEFGYDDDHYEKLTTTFANYECPRLTSIINLGFTTIDQAVFERLIRNCPNVESLEWHKHFVEFPAMTNNNLKKLSLNIYDDATVQTLIGRCPNLEEAILRLRNISASMLDQFFASVPRVQRIDMSLCCAKLNEFETKLVNFWNLGLTSLRVVAVSIDNSRLNGDSFLRKMIKSFPLIKELSLVVGGQKPTNADFASLADLQDLQFLRLILSEDGEPYDQGFRQFVHCKKIRELDVLLSKMTGGTLVKLLRSCPKLEYVQMNNITEVENPEEAAVILESLAGIAKRDITIQCRSGKYIWEGEPAKAAIKKLEENDGLKIKII